MTVLWRLTVTSQLHLSALTHQDTMDPFRSSSLHYDHRQSDDITVDSLETTGFQYRLVYGKSGRSLKLYECGVTPTQVKQTKLTGW
jgi:hypothetical protein